MKKIVCLLIVLFLFTSVKAQIERNFYQTSYNPFGVILNNSADTLNFVLNKGQSFVGIQPVVTKDTGTIAGVIRVFTSIDGVNFIATGDSLTLTDKAVNTTLWTYNKPYRFWQLTVSGGTALRAYCTAKLVSAQ